ncbi:hypothetical protein LCGC14_0282730 [marine sediment metagenome]|uniref:Uncharacterized protein n=1 Tax=marine sediment metagenome TaxID=412755 RepID=A0A0F9U0K5_9ZZZZ
MEFYQYSAYRGQSLGAGEQGYLIAFDIHQQGIGLGFGNQGTDWTFSFRFPMTICPSRLARFFQALQRSGLQNRVCALMAHSPG